ncbi:Predicted membrane protein [Ceraceosorus bombacis]|uniref:Predicted membrane protein n=1 Tax=Ceraceosorus bombacis TaxID=401625 RepID=A0A0P1BE78_9BASI|nr:Predicted membrane protein [Ceraceosorus bombacis]
MREAAAPLFELLKHGSSHSTPQTPPGDGLTAEQWSSIIGWISVACWILPSWSQLWENYVLKSGEGLSVAFLAIWLLGDALNFVGAWRQGLLVTMVVLAGYYCLCDIALIGQYYWYKKYHDFYHPPVGSLAHETTPLVSNLASPARASASSISVATIGPVPCKQPKQTSWQREALKYFFAVAVVIATGVIAWLVADRYPQDDGGHHGGDHKNPDDKPGLVWDAQVSGWASAALYLFSRVPQLKKNLTTKCEGLSLELFVFAVAGNSTYVLSVLVKSLDREYLLENSSWIVGSLGTILLDFCVLGQFIYYRKDREEARLLAAAATSGYSQHRPSAGAGLSDSERRQDVSTEA